MFEIHGRVDEKRLCNSTFNMDKANRFLIDVNLPYYFSIWNSPEFLHLRDVGENWKDEQVWNYAKTENLTIVTKDADFSNRCYGFDAAAKGNTYPIWQLEDEKFS